MIRQSAYFVSLLTAGLFLLASPGWAQQADPSRGEALFIGTVGLAEGGAPCLACHGIAGHELGHAAGASYGPDLTDLFENYGEEGITAVLENLSFGSMEAIYAGRPLTDAEITDLTAFFESAAAGVAPEIGPGMLLHVLAVTMLFMVLIGALGWRRLQSVRRPMLERAGIAKGERA